MDVAVAYIKLNNSHVFILFISIIFYISLSILFYNRNHNFSIFSIVLNSFYYIKMIFVGYSLAITKKREFFHLKNGIIKIKKEYVMLIYSKQYLKNIYSPELIEFDVELRIKEIRKIYTEKIEEIKKYLNYRQEKTSDLSIINKIDKILEAVTSIISDKNFIKIKTLDISIEKNIMQIDIIVNTINEKSAQFNLDLKNSTLDIISRINSQIY